jgi:hypothetical protein
MTTTIISPQQMLPDALAPGWVLIFGGVTRPGNRRARGSATRALASGLDVVWFDGFEETYPDTTERVPLDDPDPSARLVIVGFASTEEDTLAGRLRTGDVFRKNPVTRWLWAHFLRRMGSLLRARACWTSVRNLVGQLVDNPPPSAIVFGDDYSITSAWYAGRIWPATRIVHDLRERD